MGLPYLVEDVGELATGEEGGRDAELLGAPHEGGGRHALEAERRLAPLHAGELVPRDDLHPPCVGRRQVPLCPRHPHMRHHDTLSTTQDMAYEELWKGQGRPN